METHSEHYANIYLRFLDKKINELEIPTGNPLVIEFDTNLKIEKCYYLDKSRAKTIIFNQYS